MANETPKQRQPKLAEPIRHFTHLFFAREEGRSDDTREPIEKLKQLGYRITLIKPVENQ